MAVLGGNVKVICVSGMHYMLVSGPLSSSTTLDHLFGIGFLWLVKNLLFVLLSSFWKSCVLLGVVESVCCCRCRE